jgi:F-type H+-transporting ATPase subunit gamma
MSTQINLVKNRIKTVSGALKITNAMKLISTIRLQKYKNKMLTNREYTFEMEDIFSLVLSLLSEKDKEILKVNTDTDKKLYIIVSSTLGLCGAYNYNIFNIADAKITSNDDAIILGKKALAYYKNSSFQEIEGFDEYSSISDEMIIKKLVRFVLKAYQNGQYKEIHIIHTTYKNTIVFVAKDTTLLPLALPEEVNGYGPILEPSGKELAINLLPLYLQSSIYSKLLESEVCEQAARSNAMTNASDNANEILDNLKIEFNKARQASITEQIIEVVSGAQKV